MGLTEPMVFSLAQQVIPSGIVATGIYNGGANLAGAFALVATVLCNQLLVPLLGRYRNHGSA